MNFEDIKKEMDEAVNRDEKVVLSQVDLNRGKSNPVQKIRSNMKKEIWTQLACIVIFMVYPLVVQMPEFNEAVYYIFMFITSLMTMAYIIKLSFFLKKTSNFAANTKDAIQSFVFDAKLTLEVYKSFIIAGSLLLPFPVFALLAGNGQSAGEHLNFEKWFLLNITRTELGILIVAYLLIAVLIYFITAGWARFMYGRYLKELETVITDLED